MRLLKPDNCRDEAIALPSTTRNVPVIFERRTKGGRHLQYKLTILQQPERARACGSGQKSAADRRPVDPPPVVELLIFDITNEQPKDITFSYNANFFLFATLEHARSLVHGRVQTAAAVSPPVLTGMPVSGMAYLDRPTIAGYFLFPDLSVRHEGRYRLAFNLYEELKDAEDADIEPGERGADPQDNPAFDWRMEIKSNPFTVFSAKKFPGLTESTLLSRTVADQGCRVRIRRDVRMRRRENKGDDGHKASSHHHRERQEQRPARPAEPHSMDMYRSRSGSVHSMHSDPSMPPLSAGLPMEPPSRKMSIASQLDADPTPMQHIPPSPARSHNTNYTDYARHSSVSSHVPLEVDSALEVDPECAPYVPHSPFAAPHSSRMPRNMHHVPQPRMPGSSPAIPHLRRLSEMTSNAILPDIHPTAPPPSSSKVLNSSIDIDDSYSGSHDAMRQPSISAGTKRAREPSPSDGVRLLDGERPLIGAPMGASTGDHRTQHIWRDEKGNRRNPSLQELRLQWMSADGLARAVTSNTFLP